MIIVFIRDFFTSTDAPFSNPSPQRSHQKCFDICQGEDPNYTHFGLQYGIEARIKKARTVYLPAFRLNSSLTGLLVLEGFRIFLEQVTKLS